jgi:hypothetical protein
MTPPTAEEILSRAADLVEASWAQGAAHLSYHDGPYCAGKAMHKAGTLQRWRRGLHEPTAAEQQAWAAFCREIDCTFREVADWNDAPGRTAVEVATALRNAKRFL